MMTMIICETDQMHGILDGGIGMVSALEGRAVSLENQ
jgi:hypothetical protein